jgi:excisionase family DNA binding protein
MTKRKPSADGNGEPADYRWRTIAETAEYLKCSKRKVYELKREGRLEFVKFDHQNRVTERSLLKLMADIFREAESREPQERT